MDGPIWHSPIPPTELPPAFVDDEALRMAERCAQRPAIVDALTGRGITFGQLLDGTRRLAAGLARRGVRRGDTVAIVAVNAGTGYRARMPDQRRAVRVGALAAVAHEDGTSRDRLAERLASRGYALHRTPRFVVGSRPPARLTILMHTYDQVTVDEDLASLLAEELGPVGVLASARAYGEALFAIVASTCPPSLDCPRCGRLHLDHPALWRHYCVNTLDRLRSLLAAGTVVEPGSHIERFAAVYRRIIEHRVGESVLDVGTNLGLLPVLLGERDPGATIVGCDNRPEAVAVATDLAAAAGAGVRFATADVLAPDFADLGRFDTVTAVHLLEHLTDEELPVALANLLRATAGRLVASVPYEERVEPLYGHRQAFTPAGLRRWGRWCVATLGGGRSWCEDVAGGLLVVERGGSAATGARTSGSAAAG
jgi:SAM-dependent methyltransferase